MSDNIHKEHKVNNFEAKFKILINLKKSNNSA